jgi:hypothetical protein
LIGHIFVDRTFPRQYNQLEYSPPHQRQSWNRFLKDEDEKDRSRNCPITWIAGAIFLPGFLHRIPTLLPTESYSQLLSARAGVLQLQGS